jgi:actin-related protein
MEVRSLVLDNGGYAIRAGMGGDAEPSCIIPSIVGRPGPVSGSDLALDAFVMPDVFTQGVPLSLECPIENRIITNFDGMEKIWQFIFTTSLHLKPEEHHVLMTESPQNTKPAREKALEIMMESFKVPGFFYSYPEVLSLYSAGLTTGTVIDAGETVTDIVPVCESFPMIRIQTRMDVGGRQLNGYLKQFLVQDGVELVHHGSEQAILRDIKEKLCCVSPGIDGLGAKSDKKVEMPDGQSITIGSERFNCPEVFFNPELLPLASPTLPQLIVDTINKTAKDLKPRFFGSIMLTGGSSMFEGMGKRVEHEVSRLVSRDTKLKIVTPATGNNAAWAGGSVLVSLGAVDERWVTQAEYKETGVSAVHVRCI